MAARTQDVPSWSLTPVYDSRIPLTGAPRLLTQHQGRGLSSRNDRLSSTCAWSSQRPFPGGAEAATEIRCCSFHSLLCQLSSLSLSFPLGRKLACQVTPHLSAKCSTKAGWTLSVHGSDLLPEPPARPSVGLWGNPGL